MASSKKKEKGQTMIQPSLVYPIPHSMMYLTVKVYQKLVLQKEISPNDQLSYIGCKKPLGKGVEAQHRKSAVLSLVFIFYEGAI